MDNKRLRGGGWYNSAEVCRSAYCFWDPPSFRFSSFGFRVVKEVEPLSRVIRGGGWSSTAWFCRSAVRYGYEPSYRYDYGFRVVKGVTNGQ